MNTRMWRRRPLIIGLALDTSLLQATIIDGAAKTFTILDLKKVVLPQNFFANWEIKDSAILISTLKEIFLGYAKNSSIVAALPDQTTITKIFYFESKENEEEVLAEALLSISQAISCPITELSYDYKIICNLKNKKLILVATRTQTVISYIKIIESAGLRLKILENESHLVAQTFNSFKKRIIENKERVAVFIITQTYSLLIIVEENYPLYMRTIPFNDSHFNTSHSNFDLKINSKLFNSTLSLNKELDNDVARLIYQQLKVQLQLYQTSKENNKEFKKLFIAGQGINNHLQEFLTKELDYDFFIINPFEEIQISKNFDNKELLDQGPSWYLSCALAQRGMHGRF